MKLKSIYRLFRNSILGKDINKHVDFQSIRKLPRYTPFEVIHQGKKLCGPDNASFLFSFDEIFKRQVYYFKASSDTPVIIDGGANIGLSVIYFKTKYPGARIIAFEPDPAIFKYLKGNIESFFPGDETIELWNRALWSEEKQLEFLSEGADAGRCVLPESSESITVNAVQLSKWLTTDIDFLKIDIEGAELDVFQEISPYLSRVKGLFLESHSYKGKPRDLHRILEILHQSGFVYFVYSPYKRIINPIIELEEYAGMDMQLSIYGVRY